MLKHRNAIGLAVMAAAVIPMGVSAFAAEKENTGASAAPAKAAVCEYRVDTDAAVDSNVTLSGLKRDKDGSMYAVTQDGTKITVTMVQPESGQDEDIQVRFVCE